LDLRATEGDAGERLDRFIAARGGISRGLARRALEVGGVFLDGRRCKVAGRLLRAGQRVVVNLEEGGRAAPQAAGPLEPARILHRDRALVVVDKPPGVPAQATLVSDRGSLPERVAVSLGDPQSKIHLVHRLDRDTSGVTVLARTRSAAQVLAEAFRTGAVAKSYLALCGRAPEPAEGRIEAALDKDPLRPGFRKVSARGQPAATRYRTLARGLEVPGVAPRRLEVGAVALILLEPETGRTHQIRVHLAHLGAPILGDRRYGGAAAVADRAIPRAMLHAWRLGLTHPDGKERRWEAPLPEDFAALVRELVGEVALPA
jgi:23S rRNA pseudouridine1911/1915/1917 synthase